MDLTIPDSLVEDKFSISSWNNKISTYSTLYKFSHIPINIGAPVTTKKLKLTIMESQGEKYILNEVVLGKYHVSCCSYKCFNSQRTSLPFSLYIGSTAIGQSSSCTADPDGDYVENMMKMAILNKEKREVQATSEFGVLEGDYIHFPEFWSMKAYCLDGLYLNSMTGIWSYSLVLTLFKVLHLTQPTQLAKNGLAQMVISKMKMMRNLNGYHH